MFFAIAVTVLHVLMDFVVVRAVMAAVLHILVDRMMIGAVVLAVRHILVDGMVHIAVILAVFRVLVVRVVVRAVCSRICIPRLVVIIVMMPMSQDWDAENAHAKDSCHDSKCDFFPLS